MIRYFIQAILPGMGFLCLTALAAAESSPASPEPYVLLHMRGHGPDLVVRWVPAGDFTMGSPPNERGRNPNEEAQRQVRLRGYYIGMYPVTQAQWQMVMTGKPSFFSGKPDSPARPVEQVNWFQAQEFCRRLAAMTGKSVRLPTEAEWERACRGGSSAAFNNGGSNLCSCEANIKGSGYCSVGGRHPNHPQESRRETSRVGQFRLPNRLGLHDMHGNVWEWCDDPYPPERRQAQGEPTYRILRGGSYDEPSNEVRSARRHWDRPAAKKRNIGFRVVVGPR